MTLRFSHGEEIASSAAAYPPYLIPCNPCEVSLHVKNTESPSGVAPP